MKSFESDGNPVCSTLISVVNVEYNNGYRPDFQRRLMEILRAREQAKIAPTGTVSVQTMFREAETQTDPFAPEFKAPADRNLEVLTLSWLSWNNGLPAGMREIKVIERARQKKAWFHALPPVFNSLSLHILSMILESIELNEWNHREAELSAVSSLRLEFARQCMQQILARNRSKCEKRLLKYTKKRSEEVQASLTKVRYELKRNLRRLTYAHNVNANRKYRKWDVFEELHNKTSETYAPQLRFGHNPKREHEYIPKQFRFWNVFSHGEILTHTAKAVKKMTELNQFQSYSTVKLRERKRLCSRETRWTLFELESWYKMAKEHRRKESKKQEKKLCLREKVVSADVNVAIPAVKGIPDEEELAHQTAICLQKIIKGRAVQAVMFEGRARCQELLDELKSTHALQRCMEDVTNEARLEVNKNLRSKEMVKLEEERRRALLLSLEGKTVSETLDFLSKELIRLRTEREIHAIVLMAVRERNLREAAEAGRRQKEIQRSSELDEIWKQICKVVQNSLDTYAEEYTSTVRKLIGEEEARKAATKYARKVEQAANEAHMRKNQLEEEEIVADLVYNFALPEAEKEIVRARLKTKQKLMLATCHDEIYTQIELVARGERTSSGKLVPMLRPKHKKQDEVINNYDERLDDYDYSELNS